MANTSQPIVLIDTCVLMLDPDVIVRVRGNNGLPILTSTVLDELDYNKKGDEKINVNARAIFREFNSGPTDRLQILPNGGALIGDDILTSCHFRGGPVFLLARKHFQTSSNNDAKIIELASDYKFVLITRDQAMRVRAQALGVDAHYWEGRDGQPPNQGRNNQQRSTPNRGDRDGGIEQSGRRVEQGVRPFSVSKEAISDQDTLIEIDRIPTTGDVLRSTSGAVLKLGKSVSAGGEGTIYETAASKVVCKIYHKSHLTDLKRRKIELMVSRKVVFKGICWPIEMVANEQGIFVGYTMPRASGKTMQSAMFVKPVLEKNFPNWTRKDLVKLCIELIEEIQYLHHLNILIGDINPLNLLVTENSSEVWIVDTDSFQVENYPCPVSTVNFTPPENQSKNHNTFLRTKDHELFAVATMLFMILLPGKPPYSQQGGASPGENIKARNFPYSFRVAEEVFSGKNAPQGPWQFIWGNLDYLMKEGFHLTFRENKRITVDDWRRRLLRYLDTLEQGRYSSELFPLNYPVRDPLDTTCSCCGKQFVASKGFVEKLQVEGKQIWCPQCSAQKKIERLARNSMRDANGIAGGGTRSFPSSGHPNPLRNNPFPANFGSSSQRPVNKPTYAPNRSSSYSQVPRPQPVAPKGGLLSAIFRAIFK